MLSIDEAIEKFKLIANSDAPCPRYCMLPCDKCVDESKRLAEYLEELKAIKDGSIPIIHGKAELELHDKAIRNKAIDDFAGRIIRYVDCGHLCSPSEMRWSDLSVVEMVKKLAEQLKAGGENEI